MPTRKIRDLPQQQSCRDPEHDPPKHHFFEDGVYEHTCPMCGRRQEFTVDRAWVQRALGQAFQAWRM